jgi:hypothetical protein
VTKRRLVLCLSLVVFLVPALAAGRASAATLFVSPTGNDAGTCVEGAPCKTIQRAINVAPSPSTIEVAAGKYSENVLVNKQGMTLRGAQAGNPRPGRTVPIAQESLISSSNQSVKVSKNETTIEGFAFENPTVGGVAIAAEQITNLVVRDNLRDGALDGGEGELLLVANATSLVIKGNRVVKTAAPALIFTGNTTASVVEENEFTKGSSTGIEITGANGPNKELSIVGNDLSSLGRGVWVFPGAIGADVRISENALADETFFGIRNEAAGAYDARRNWWGCNGGANAPGCSKLFNNATAPDVTDPLALSLVAEPTAALTGSVVGLRADLVGSLSGTRATRFPAGKAVAFGTSLGSISAVTPTAAGRATASLTSALAGAASVTASLNSQETAAAVTFSAPAPPDPPDNGGGGNNNGGGNNGGGGSNNSNGGSGGGTTPTTPPGRPRLIVKPGKAPVKAGALRLAVECRADADQQCAGILVVRFRGTEAKESYEVGAGRSRTVAVPLGEVALGRLANAGASAKGSASARTLQVTGGPEVHTRSVRFG